MGRGCDGLNHLVKHDIPFLHQLSWYSGAVKFILIPFGLSFCTAPPFSDGSSDILKVRPFQATLPVLSTLVKLIEGITRKKALQERGLDSRTGEERYRGDRYSITNGWKSGERYMGLKSFDFACFMTNVEVITSSSYYLSGSLPPLLRSVHRWSGHRVSGAWVRVVYGELHIFALAVL
jgi:hypothetical protein